MAAGIFLQSKSKWQNGAGKDCLLAQLFLEKIDIILTRVECKTC